MHTQFSFAFSRNSSLILISLIDKSGYQCGQLLFFSDIVCFLVHWGFRGRFCYLQRNGRTVSKISKDSRVSIEGTNITSEAAVSKWLSGTHNFTFSTIGKISAALNAPIIQVATSLNGDIAIGESAMVAESDWL